MGSALGQYGVAAAGKRSKQDAALQTHIQNVEAMKKMQDNLGMERPSGGVSGLGVPALAARQAKIDNIVAPDITDQIIKNVAAAERARAKLGKTRQSMFDGAMPSASPMKLEKPPPPTKK